MVNWLDYLDNKNTNINVATPKTTVKPTTIKQKTEPAKDSTLAIERMRLLDGNSGDTNDNRLTNQFVKQIRFMQSCEDAFEKMIIPETGISYSELSNDELRSYFTWRTQLKSSKHSIAPKVFVILRLEEIVNDQLNTPQFVISKLLEFWNNVHSLNSDVDTICHEFIVDYYLTHDTDLNYLKDIASKYPSQFNDPYIAISDIIDSRYSNAPFYLYQKATYKIKDTQIYLENKATYNNCLVEVLNGLNNYFRSYGHDFNALLLGDKTPTTYIPFKKYLVAKPTLNDRNITLTKHCRFQIKDNCISTITYESTLFSSLFVDYILKCTEAELNNISHHQHVDNLSVSKAFEICIPNNGLYEVITRNAFKLNIKHSIQNYFLKGQMKTQTSSNQVFSKMRSLVMPANTFNREDTEPYFDYRAIRFNAQANFLANYEDNVTKFEHFNSDITPLYTDLSDEQLRSYFTWRKYARLGNIVKTDYPYVLLYLAEQFNMVNEKDPTLVLQKIIAFWKKYRVLDGTIDTDIPNWIRDFYLHYNLSCDYHEILLSLGNLPKDSSTSIYELSQHNYSLKTRFFDSHSSYHFINSPYSRVLLFTIEDTIPMVFDALQNLLTQNGYDFNELLLGDIEEDHCWKPFRNTIVEIKALGSNRIKTITPQDTFEYVDGFWKSKQLTLANDACVIIGYIIRTIESRLRAYTHFKTPLKSDRSSLKRAINNNQKFEKILLSDDFTNTIIETVDSYLTEHQQLNNYFDSPEDIRPVKEQIKPVKVDFSKLSAIRNAANDIQEKLIIEDEEEQIQSTETKAPQPSIDVNDDNPLSIAQRKCISVLLSGEDVYNRISSIGKEAGGILPEALLESINDALYDIFNDNIVVIDEETPYIYEDYVQDAEKYGE